MSLPNTNITVGAAPLLWSDVAEAFTKINENFTSLDLATGGDAVNLENLFTSVSPSANSVYSLGTLSNKWKTAYVGEYADSPGSDDNGVFLGSAHLKGIGSVVELPAGSTVAGNLIIDPDKTFFKSVQVDAGNQVVANSFSDTLNLNSGTAVQLIVDSSAESITINNTGVTSLVSGTAMSVSSATGNVTINNTGVTSLTGSTPVVGRAAGAGISVSSGTGNVTLTNTGLLGVQAGFGITVSTDSASGISQISFNPTAAPQTGFTTIAVPGQTSITSDTISDTLTLAAGYGLTLTTTESTDRITFTLNQDIDINGSVFGDDSTLLVDGVSNFIYGNVRATTLRTDDSTIALGSSAGVSNQGINSIAIGFVAGGYDQGLGAIAIGSDAANTSQGDYAIAIGNLAGGLTQGQGSIAIGREAGNGGTFAGSIILSATGVATSSSAAGFYVDPIRSTANGTPLMYNSTTKELFYSTVLEFIGSTISTSDSSGLTIDVLTTFNTDIVAQNDLTVAERLTVKGSRVINLTELKAVVAASTDFTDFKSRIAALV